MTFPKLHASTIAFLTLVAAIILLANIPGQIVSETEIDNAPPGKIGPEFSITTKCHHGWPFAFLVREQVPTAGAAPPWRGLSPWDFSKGIVELRWWWLAGDVLVGLTVLFIAGVGCERWRRRRGCFQLCLIDMFVLVTLVACGLAYWATLAAEHTRQANAVAQLERQHAPGGLDIEWSSGGPSWLREVLGDRPFAAADRVVSVVFVDRKGLAQLAELPNVKVVWTAGSFRSNAQLEVLSKLPDLEALVMIFPSLSHEKTDENGERVEVSNTDPGVRLPPLPHLRGLTMNLAAFHGEGLEYLRDIEVLDLTDAGIDDAVMPKFAAMRKLHILSLAGTNITDAGLEHLRGLSELRILFLGQETRFDLKPRLATDIKITAKGVKRLQQALPNCKIELVPVWHGSVGKGDGGGCRLRLLAERNALGDSHLRPLVARQSPR
jgi:hypothetical protein